MRAALVNEIGAPPTLGDRPEPMPDDGTTLVTIDAVALNPVDVAIAAGAFYAGHPPVPFVVGLEGVGHTDDGRQVYCQGAGKGIGADGFAAERVAVPDDVPIEIPAGSDPAVAVALGTAGMAGWLSVTWRGRCGDGDRVVVLGASGAVGNIAVQAAKHAGATSVVAVGRDEHRLANAATHANGAIALTEDLSDLADQLVEAAGGPPTLVIDTLWGPVIEAVLPAVGLGARVVQIGASAGTVATIDSAAVRGKQLELLGYSNFGVPPADRAAAYRTMVELANAGRLEVPVKTFTLDQLDEAWATARDGGAKAVLVPGTTS